MTDPATTTVSPEELGESARVKAEGLERSGIEGVAELDDSVPAEIVDVPSQEAELSELPKDMVTLRAQVSVRPLDRIARSWPLHSPNIKIGVAVMRCSDGCAGSTPPHSPRVTTNLPPGTENGP